ncbi:3482_t:CDS:1, partial [Acaulospora morrowiae]
LNTQEKTRPDPKNPPATACQLRCECREAVMAVIVITSPTRNHKENDDLREMDEAKDLIRC